MQPRDRQIAHAHLLAPNDPRSSLTQSLVPAHRPVADGRRKLLLIYIHGFMGNETSFRSFPAHVHNLISVMLCETHVAHSKIYPKYPARNSVEHATERFSRWLTPHAAPHMDIVLLGHSMGGLVSAEAVFLPPRTPGARHGDGPAFRHRILGVVNFDVPFLGIHPGVIPAGLSSIFRPAQEKSSDQAVGRSAHHPAPPLRADTLFSAKPDDPNYNPRFHNDIILPARKGWRNALHFLAKHSDDLVEASKRYVRSHLEFGGTMADYPGLHRRYNRLRALEEDDEAKRREALAPDQRRAPSVPRVRFVNFYTVSTGRLKRPNEASEAAIVFDELAVSGPSLDPPGRRSGSPRHEELVAEAERERPTVRREMIRSPPEDESSHSPRRHGGTSSRTTSPPSHPHAQGEPKDRKFCVLPPTNPRTGQRDPTWIRVCMEGMDEVGAHCGLFVMGETYERLVGEVADRIERWILDDAGERAVRELENQII